MFVLCVEFMAVTAIAACVLVWIFIKRVLAPLRLLARTIGSINSSNLAQRLPVGGKGEIAELTVTFNAMMDRLEAAFASQQNFINDAGHELRTPLTIIRGHLQFFGGDPQQQQETLEIVMGELKRMSRFVDELILLAKAEQPDFLHLETVHTGLLMEELFAKVRILADRDWHLELGDTGEIVVDYQRITQAVMNLVQNAAQHTTEGDAISIGSEIAADEIRFWVSDTGAGIAPEERERIFERFVRGADSHCRAGGAGLGLSIVRAIAQAHGGRIELLSELTRGSTFTIIIPRQIREESLFDEPDSDCRGRVSNCSLPRKRVAG